MWRFDIGDEDPAAWTGKRIFTAPSGSKIFYPPGVTLEKDTVNYEMIFFGTGDREDPKNTSVVNRTYGFKDKNPGTPLTESSLTDVTTSLLTGTDTTNGWFIRLTNAGEKSLATPVVFYKAAYYTTFTPTFGVEGDPCFVGEGTARLYIMKYQTGSPMFNLDLSNDSSEPVVDRSDRSKVIGTAIPSGVIITFIRGEAVAYVGVGGGVRRGREEGGDDGGGGGGGGRPPDFPIPSGKSLVPTYWRTIF
jgi:type IV pilus assembly protein PilY1